MESITAASIKIWGDIAGYVAWEKGESAAGHVGSRVLDYSFHKENK